mgnify:CR=1 FL=1
MPEHARTPIAQPKRAANMRRWPLYAAAAVAGVLVIAWFDGGEEPIRPIVQPLALPQGSAG